MSDSHESFYILSDIKPHSFESLVKQLTYSINYEELAVASAFMDPEQPPMALTPVPGPQQELD